MTTDKKHNVSVLPFFLSVLIGVHLWPTPLLFAADPPEPKFRHRTIDDKIEIGYGVVASDVDGDGKTDILLADKRQFVWYRNPTWEKFVIAENLTKRDNVCLAAEDLDGDGKCELAVGGDWAPEDRETSGAVFYMIPPADRTQKWEAVELHAEPTVHRMRWMKLDGGDWGLVVVPLHGRGKDGKAGSRVLIYRKPSGPRGQWETEVITDSMHLTHNFEVLGSSILLAGRESVSQFDRLSPGDWKRNAVAEESSRPSFRGAGEVRTGTTWHRGAGLHFTAMIEPMHGQLVTVLVPDHEAVAIMAHRLTDRLVEGHALACGDVVGSGGDQVIAGWRGNKGGIKLWTAMDSNSRNWRESTIDDGGMACEDLCLADLDGDKDLDIIASGRATKNVKIYWNETPSAGPAPSTKPANRP